MGGYVLIIISIHFSIMAVTDVINKPFSKLRYEINYDKSLYIIVAESSFRETGMTWKSMMNYVSNGNTLFISAEYIDEKLIDTLGAKVSFDFSTFLRKVSIIWKRKIHGFLWRRKPAADKQKYGFFFVPF